MGVEEFLPETARSLWPLNELAWGPPGFSFPASGVYRLGLQPSTWPSLCGLLGPQS